MKFKFAGTQKMYDNGGSFMCMGVDLMAHQGAWGRPNNEFIRLKMHIGDAKTLFEPYVYQLKLKDKILTFASGEISNGIWGFALPDE